MGPHPLRFGPGVAADWTPLMSCMQRAFGPSTQWSSKKPVAEPCPSSVWWPTPPITSAPALGHGWAVLRDRRCCPAGVRRLSAARRTASMPAALRVVDVIIVDDIGGWAQGGATQKRSRPDWGLILKPSYIISRVFSLSPPHMEARQGNQQEDRIIQTTGGSGLLRCDLLAGLCTFRLRRSATL